MTANPTTERTPAMQPCQMATLANDAADLLQQIKDNDPNMRLEPTSDLPWLIDRLRRMSGVYAAISE